MKSSLWLENVISNYYAGHFGPKLIKYFLNFCRVVWNMRKYTAYIIDSWLLKTLIPLWYVWSIILQLSNNCSLSNFDSLRLGLFSGNFFYHLRAYIINYTLFQLFCHCDKDYVAVLIIMEIWKIHCFQHVFK